MTQMMEAPQSEQKQRTALVPARLPYPGELAYKSFGVDQGSWKALVEAIFPNAQSSESVILALSYCRARKLDPFKRNVHIVPIWDSKRGGYVDTIWPGIGELRTTAFRTGEYAGRDEAKFGADISKKLGTADITFPEWAQVTVYRLVQGQRVAFAGPKVYWLETYATRKHNEDTPNEMWATRVRGQIEKCAEAAALRAAFPEEVGSEYIPEEAMSVGDRTAKSVDSREVKPSGAVALKERLALSTADELPAPSRPPEESERIIREKAEQARQAQTAKPAPEQINTDTGEVTDESQLAASADAAAEQQGQDEAAAIALDELIEQGPEAIKKSLREKYQEFSGRISKADFEGGVFKYAVRWGGEGLIPADGWKALYRAVCEKRFDVKKGAIVAEQ